MEMRHALKLCARCLQSYLVRDEKNARFYGELDIKTLGGAGFASQRTVTEDSNWDLSGYAGIQLDIAKGDSKLALELLCGHVEIECWELTAIQRSATLSS